MSIIDVFRRGRPRQERERSTGVNENGANDIIPASAQNEELINKIYATFEEYRSAYMPEWERLDGCEHIYRGDHWYDIDNQAPNEPRPVTPIIQSTIENVASDLMDNFPEAIVQPETPDDEIIARVVNEIIKQNHDASGYDKEYWRLSHDLLVGGYCVQEVGYDPELNNGLGGSYIRHVDIAGVMFDPLITDIQDSRAIIKYTPKSLAWLEKHYPDAAPFKGDYYVSDTYSTHSDNVLNVDNSKTAMLIEYWWREYNPSTGRYAVHLVKAAGRKIVEDSRSIKPDGYYKHGKYPFVLTPLFIRKGSPLGWGIVDMFRTQQRFSDKLDQIVLKNALMSSHNKLLITGSSGFDAEDLRDWAKEVHEGDSLNGITWFSTPPLPSYIIEYIQTIRKSIKDESGANDFSRGTTNSGVTAASAIAVLQEQASKRARMAARQMHGAYKDAVRMEIEVEREFNVLPRQVFINNDGAKEAYTFDSAIMVRHTELGNEIPIEFSVSIKVQKENKWSIMAHNELILQIAQICGGAIGPDAIIELMQFEGKEAVLSKIRAQPQQLNVQQNENQQIIEDMAQVPNPKNLSANMNIS